MTETHPRAPRRRSRSERISRRSTVLRERLQSRTDDMLTRSRTGRRGTRVRALPMMGAGLGAVAAMFVLVSQSVLAVNFTTSDTAYRIYTDRVSGHYAASYINEQTTNAGKKAVVQFGFKAASLNGFCAITKQDLPALGTVSVVITAGEPVDGTTTAPAGKTIEANWLYLASDSLTGNGDQIAKMNLGQSADTLMTDTTAFPGTPGGFGLQAEVMNISKLDAASYGIGLDGQISLPDLKIRVLPGARGYADCASA